MNKLYFLLFFFFPLVLKASDYSFLEKDSDNDYEAKEEDKVEINYEIDKEYASMPIGNIHYVALWVKPEKKIIDIKKYIADKINTAVANNVLTDNLDQKKNNFKIKPRIFYDQVVLLYKNNEFFDSKTAEDLGSEMSQDDFVYIQIKKKSRRLPKIK